MQVKRKGSVVQNRAKTGQCRIEGRKIVAGLELKGKGGKDEDYQRDLCILILDQILPILKKDRKYILDQILLFLDQILLFYLKFYLFSRKIAVLEISFYQILRFMIQFLFLLKKCGI